MDYKVKNVKTGPSREYGPKGSYTCTLYRGNKKVATAFEAGDGGEMRVDWLDRGKGTTVERTRKNGFVQRVTKEQELFLNHAESTKYICEFTKEVESYDEFLFIAMLVGEFEEEKQIKGWCRTKTVLRMKSDKDGEFSIYKCKYSPKVKAAFEARFGDDLVEIVNERFVA